MSSATLQAQIIPPVIKDAVRQGATLSEVTSTMVRALEEAFEPCESLHDAQMRVAGIAGRLKLLREEGGCVDSNTAAELYAANPSKVVNPEAVRKAAREKRLISIRDGHDNWMFPVWQFAERGGVLDGLPETLKELEKRPGYSDITPFIFFLQNHARTNGRPLDALRAGDKKAAIEAAIAARE
jgi:hypothetical protein